MAFEIFLHPTAATGGPKAFNAGVSRALSAINAQHSPAAETVRLADRTQVHLFLDGDIAMLTTREMTPTVSAAVLRMAQDTASVIKVDGDFYLAPDADGQSAVQPTGFPGAVHIRNARDLDSLLQGLFEDWQAAQATEVLRKEAVARAVNVRRSAARQTRKPLPDLVSKPQSSILRRLSDALFGKAL